MMLKGGGSREAVRPLQGKKHQYVLHVDPVSSTLVCLAVLSLQANKSMSSFLKVLQCFLSNLDLISIVCHHEKLGIRSLLPHYPSQVSGLLTTSIHTL